MFKRGTYEFNKEPNFNFQLNRTVMWGYGDAEEIKKVSQSIVTSDDWVKTLRDLASKAEKEGRTEAQIGYLRMAEFFMYEDHPDKLKVYHEAKDLFYQFNENKIKENGIISTKVPYNNGYLPVMSCKAKGKYQGTILLHGGNDSYIEEFFTGLLYFQEKGFDVYLFEGPGQGGVLREQNMKFDYAWEKPVKAILDYFNLNNIIIIGTSLGGYLAPRAAAFEKRIKKVICWSIFPDFFDVVLYDIPKPLKSMVNLFFKLKIETILNPIYRKLMEKDELLKWGILHGMYAYGAKDPMGYAKILRQFTLKGIEDKITQDIFILAGKEDHFINPNLFHELYDLLLPNAKSLAYQLYTNKDDAGSHCNVGNMKLTLDTMISWILLMNSKDEENHQKSS
ncbi:alpha/beta-hydrolase [Anaeromyces robustus]|uniref:Alpha/beta-hydrolase n=1 Tax=Anaeromyces robustus TaxID=1754192 RepID=A0A1Y1WQW6_9FUNG|nr:alpha/beta-hydrolase [Anaeromyces robustus]|eukprot:ORX75927.1 alpha/beta-hydrolase [Anaeromyces robustus]